MSRQAGQVSGLPPQWQQLGHPPAHERHVEHAGRVGGGGEQADQAVLAHAVVGGQPDADQVEPLMVVTTGTGAKLALVAAGTHVCNAKVQAEAPAGIRVLACGF